MRLLFLCTTAAGCSTLLDDPLACGDGTIEIEDECVVDTGPHSDGAGLPQELSVTSSVETCTDFNFDDPADSTIEGEYRGNGVVGVRRTFVVLESSSLSFVPEIEVDDPEVRVLERWEGDDDGITYCREPLIEMSGVTSGVTVAWYLPGQREPYGVIDVAADD